MCGHVEKCRDAHLLECYEKCCACLNILSEQADGDDVGYPITCGDCKAVLLVKKFVCPGINVKCVKVCIQCGSKLKPEGNWVSLVYICIGSYNLYC